MLLAFFKKFGSLCKILEKIELWDDYSSAIYYFFDESISSIC